MCTCADGWVYTCVDVQTCTRHLVRHFANPCPWSWWWCSQCCDGSSCSDADQRLWIHVLPTRAPNCRLWTTGLKPPGIHNWAVYSPILTPSRCPLSRGPGRVKHYFRLPRSPQSFSVSGLDGDYFSTSGAILSLSFLLNSALVGPEPYRQYVNNQV